jgi:hypothetical protein
MVSPSGVNVSICLKAHSGSPYSQPKSQELVFLYTKHLKFYKASFFGLTILFVLQLAIYLQLQIKSKNYVQVGAISVKKAGVLIKNSSDKIRNGIQKAP